MGSLVSVLLATSLLFGGAQAMQGPNGAGGGAVAQGCGRAIAHRGFWVTVGIVLTQVSSIRESFAKKKEFSKKRNYVCENLLNMELRKVTNPDNDFDAADENYSCNVLKSLNMSCPDSWDVNGREKYANDLYEKYHPVCVRALLVGSDSYTKCGAYRAMSKSVREALGWEVPGLSHVDMVRDCPYPDDMKLPESGDAQLSSLGEIFKDVLDKLEKEKVERVDAANGN